MQKIKLKRGDTLALSCTLADNGVAVDLTGWAVKAQLRTPDGALVNELTYTVVNAAAGQYALSSTGATTAWPVNTTLEGDIQYTSPAGVITSSETFQVQMVKDITQ